MDWARILAYVTGTVDQELLTTRAERRPDDGRLERLNGVTIHLPTRVKGRPDRNRLALRFERYKSVA
jgi:hypothetical protein